MRVPRRCKRVPRKAIMRGRRTPRIRTARFCVGVLLVDRRNPSNEYDFLASLGVEPGEFNRAMHGYKYAKMPLEAYAKLRESWGRFFWSLHPEGDL